MIKSNGTIARAERVLYGSERVPGRRKYVGEDGTLKQFLDKYCRHRLLTKEEVIGLTRRIREDHDEKAREELIRHNQRLVLRIAERYEGRGVSLIDLIQEGNLGLIRATQLYDETTTYNRNGKKGTVKFSTYATHWIKKAVNIAVEYQGGFIRMPPKVFIAAPKVDNLVKQYEKDGKQPDWRKIARKTKLSVQIAKAALTAYRVRTMSMYIPVSNGRQVSSDNEHVSLDSIAESGEEDDSVERSYLSNKVRTLLGRIRYLRAEERFAVEQLILSDNPPTLGVLGRDGWLRRFGKTITGERVRQIKEAAIKKMKSDIKLYSLYINSRLIPH